MSNRSHGDGLLPEYVVRRLRQQPPDGVPVVPGSTPVLSFGNPWTASVATVGLNPSRREFLDVDGALLDAEQRRFVDQAALGGVDLADAPEEALLNVVEGCDTYFDRNPYWQWFRPLDRLLLRGLDASYVDGTACHLDLSQWATDPTWSGLSSVHQAALIKQDGWFLREQWAEENITVVLLNGRAVVAQIQAAGLVDLEEVGAVSNQHLTTKIFSGQSNGVRVLGWSSNLQSQPGVSNALIDDLADALRGLLAATTAQAGTDGRIAAGTVVRSKSDLAVLLRTWLDETDEPTIGDVGAFGGKPYVRVELPGQRVVLNADTKRAAVADYLTAVVEHGPDLAWPVVANARGRVNKVVYEGRPSPAGWYAYVTPALDAPTVL